MIQLLQVLAWPVAAVAIALCLLAAVLRGLDIFVHLDRRASIMRDHADRLEGLDARKASVRDVEHLEERLGKLERALGDGD